MMWNFNRILNFLTALGALPILICLFIKQFPSLPLQHIIFVYIAIVLSFIAGIDWLIGVKLRSLPIVIWSIICSLIPFFLYFMHVLLTETVTSSVTLLLLLAQLWVMLLADINIYTWADINQALSFRRIGTLFLSIFILVNIAVSILI